MEADQRRVGERRIPTEAGAEGRDTEGGRERGAKAWHPDGGRSTDPASDASSTSIRERRTSVGGRHRFRKVLRSSQSRRVDVKTGEANQRQANTAIDPKIPASRDDGGRVIESAERRNAAGRAAIPIAVKHPARRT